MKNSFLERIEINELINLEFNFKRKNLNIEEIKKLLLYYKVN